MPDAKLADNLQKDAEKIRAAYKNGKRTYKVQNVMFRIRRCGPESNYLAVSPVSKHMVVPVLNIPYDLAKHERMMEARRGKDQDIPKRWQKGRR